MAYRMSFFKNVLLDFHGYTWYNNSMLRHKFKNKITTYNGVKYRSKLEAQYAMHLDKLKTDGTVLFYNRQPKFDFPDGNSYTADFTVYYAEGYVEIVDTKGVETPDFKRNIKSMQFHYPYFDVKVVKKGEF